VAGPRRLALGAVGMTPEVQRNYPRAVHVDGGEMTLRYMRPRDGEALVAFVRSLPAHDLLFLRRDITQPEGIEYWVQGLERGTIFTVLAERAGAVHGYAAIVREEVSWSPHVAELRVLVSEAMRGKGLGRLLTQEAFAVALGLGIEKMMAQMTLDQKGAIAVFEGMGFHPEALLRDHVRDRDGNKHDLLVLSRDVVKFLAQMNAYGVSEALAGSQ
jgi:L-amino acid N-acyltransferase YncA